MNNQAISILQNLYHNTYDKTFITLEELEVLFGLSGFELRSYLEDLKDIGYVIEAEEGFQISDIGKNYGDRLWV